MSVRILVTEPDLVQEAVLRQLIALGEVKSASDGGEVDVLWTGLSKRIDQEVLNACRPKVVVSPTTGLGHIDEAACQEMGIAVLSLQGEREFLRGVWATAEHTMALMLALVRRLPQAFQDVTGGGWDRARFIGTELGSKTLGLLGGGRVATQVAALAKAFGMGIILFDGFPRLRATVLDQCHLVSVHLPLLPATWGCIDTPVFRSMREGAFFINTSRGEIIRESALLDALASGHLAGAAVDVVLGEPDQVKQSKLIQYVRAGGTDLLITPHLGGATWESLEKTQLFMVEKLKRHLQDRALLNGGVLSAG